MADTTIIISNVLPVVDDWTVASRNRTLFLMRLCLAAYPTCEEGWQHGYGCTSSKEAMEPILQNGQSTFGSTIQDFDQETNAVRELRIQNRQLLQLQPPPQQPNDDNDGINDTTTNSTTNSSSTPLPKVEWRSLSLPASTAEYTVGVQALEYTLVDQNVTILAFRGTYTDGDYTNIENWISDYILEKSTSRMKEAWTQDAALEWTTQQQLHAHLSSPQEDALAKLEIRSAESFLLKQSDKPLKDTFTNQPSMLETLVETVNANTTLVDNLGGGGLSLKEAEATGYWKLTKYLVDQVSQRAKDANRTLIITGHSQGGTRAQLASMYLQHTTGFAHPTVTFAATGSSCVARLLFYKNANLLQTVNPFIPHPQMTEYVHPLDPWGNSMLGKDNGASTCWLWKNMTGNLTDGGDDLPPSVQQPEHTTDQIVQDDPAYIYCSRIYGWSGPILIAANAGIYNHNTQGREEELRLDFSRCRYFTHNAEAMLAALQVSLLDDGTTSSGCPPIPVIPREDVNGTCPIGRASLLEEEIAIGLVVFLAIFCFVVCWCLLFCLCCGYCKRPCRRSLGMPMSSWTTTTKSTNDYDIAQAQDDELLLQDSDDEVMEPNGREEESEIELPPIT